MINVVQVAKLILSNKNIMGRKLTNAQWRH